MIPDDLLTAFIVLAVAALGFVGVWLLLELIYVCRRLFAAWLELD